MEVNIIEKILFSNSSRGMNKAFYDVIVVGGGISGLTTAYRLLQYDQSLKILVLEAKGKDQQAILHKKSLQ